MHRRQASTLSSILEDNSRFSWVDRIAEPAQSVAKKIFHSTPAGRTVKNVLNGTVFNHRLHPAFVSIPLGAWTTSMVFDVLGCRATGEHKRPYQLSADAAIAIGIAGSLPAAKTGLADWVDLYDHRRRAGTAHALLNVAALACYGTSLALRKCNPDARTPALVLSTLGFGLATTGGALGGELVYTLGINTPHNLYPKPPSGYTDVMASSDLPEGKPVLVEVGRVPAIVVRRGEDIFAVDAWCPHAGGPLADGTFEGDVVECPWHQSRFCLRDGRALQGPATTPLRTFIAKEEQGRVLLKPDYEGESWPPPPSPPQPEPVAIEN